MTPQQVEVRGAWVLVLAVIIFGLVGSALVGTGLLSHRQVLQDRASASDATSMCVPPVDQVVVLLVDALRPDFAFPAYNPKFARKSSGAPSEGDAPNRDFVGFSFVQDSLTSETDMAVGLVMVADAPTTTSQRLKAIVTGGIPAFVEAGGNFNSDLVTEDNIIFQLNRSSTVLGDDTWLSLFTEQDWGQSYVYPSFDVRDLHTVDNGVLRHLDSVLEPFTPSSPPQDSSSQPHPKLVLAHFLGVDHAGHRFSARDEHMVSKLVQLNAVIARVSATLEDRRRRLGGRTMLLVFGDHGMTESGDHGGAATDETDTFLYARLFASSDDAPSSNNKEALMMEQEKPLETRNFTSVRNVIQRISTDRQENCTHLCRFYEREPMPVRLDAQETNFVPGTFQVDLVPTFAFLLGIPIPYSNLGRLLPEVVALSLAERGFSEAELWKSLANAAECNARQLNRFLERLNLTSRVDLTLQEGQEGSLGRLQSIVQQMDRVTGAARKEWTSIQLDRMVAGAAFLILGVLVATPAMMYSASRRTVARQSFTSGPAARPLHVAGALVLALLAIVTIASILRSSGTTAGTWGLVVSTFLLGACVLLKSSPLALLSMQRYLRYALSWISLTQGRQLRGPAPRAGLKEDQIRRTEWLVTSVLFGVIFLRYGTVFSNSFIVFEVDAVLFALGCVTLVSGALHFIGTGSMEALKRSSMGLLALRFASQSGLRTRYHGTHIIAAASPASQLLEQVSSHLREFLGGASSVSSPPAGHSSIQQGVSVMGLMAVLLAFWLNPESMSWRRLVGVTSMICLTSFALVVLVEDTTLLHPLGIIAVVLHLGSRVRRSNRPGPRQSFRIVTVTYALFWVTALAATERHVTRFVLALLIVGVRQLASASQLVLSASSNLSNTVQFQVPVASTRLVECFSLHLCSWIAFFALSQQCVISSINWNAGFVGLADYNMFLSGSLVYLHTFSAFLITPILWKYFRNQAVRCDVKSTEPHPAGSSTADATHLMTSWLTLAVAQVALMSIAVTLHRRHLMLWAIFCPKFIYDVIVMLSSILAVFLALLV